MPAYLIADIEVTDVGAYERSIGGTFRR